MQGMTQAKRVSRSTCGRAPLLRAKRAGSAIALLLLTVLATTSHADDALQVTTARVIWFRAPHLYVVADSGVLAPGTPLSIRRGRRDVATATVVRLLEPHLALARITTGSLDREKKLDKLSVRSGIAPIAERVTLRVGLPAPERSNWLFTCRAPRWNAGTPGAPYVADTLSRRVVRLARTRGSQPGEPDTLLIRFFADAADEEIALERGELDAAVFWPGEVSSRMRADARWREPSLVRRARGVLACEWSDSLVPDPAMLASLKDGVFAGDLEPLVSPTLPGAAPPRLVRLTPDPRLPGAAALERALAKPGTRGPALQLSYLADADPTSLPVGVRGLFALRCVVVTSQAVRGGWPAFHGAAELANLLQCGSAR